MKKVSYLVFVSPMEMEVSEIKCGVEEDLVFSDASR